MDEVLDLLTAWGLPELGPLFVKNQINIKALAVLTTEDLREIIPQLGPRALFVRCWKAWAADFAGSSTTDTTNENIDLSNIYIDLPVLIDEYLPTHDTSLVRAEKTQQTSPTKYTSVRNNLINVKQSWRPCYC